MSPVETQCPGCGAPIRFALGSSLVVVCPNCRSVVARGDQRLEDLGKVAALVDTGSPLEVGRKGRYRGMPFELTGRAQFAQEAGATWDEWYASFPNDRWGWLAEAQGHFFLTFARHLPAGASLPERQKIALGQRFTLPGVGDLLAQEIGEAKAQSAEGEIPYRLVPGETWEYVDLSGAGGKFATLDYSEDQPLVFLGEEVTLDDLGISPAAATEREPRHVAALQVSCPNCGGTLDLKAPDVAQRVACPYCNSLLDCTQGKLQFLAALEPGHIKPCISLGAVGTLGGKSYTVIGFMVRHVTLDGVNYPWREFLLYGVGIGFRWLVESDGHWNFVQSVPPGEIEVGGHIATYQRQHFRLFQQTPAYVDFVSGEFYWKVHVGERPVLSSDFVAPPRILSREISIPETPGASAAATEALADGAATPSAALSSNAAVMARLAAHGEVNWSLGTYMPREEIARAFKADKLPLPTGVAPNQPFPVKGVYRSAAILMAAAIGVWLGMYWLHQPRKIIEKAYTLTATEAKAAAPAQPAGTTPTAAEIAAQIMPGTPPGPETTATVFESPLALDAHRRVRVLISSPVDNSWLHVDGDLFNEETGLVQPFAVDVEYYHGFDSDGSWTEGAREAGASLSAVPAGNYTLRLEAQWEHMQSPINMTVRVDEPGPRLLYFFVLLGGLAIVPIVTAFFQIKFEAKRWEDSEYKPVTVPTFESSD